MTTGLGLYGAPKTSWPSVLSVDSTTPAINIEVAGESADSTSFVVNIEVSDEAASSTTAIINIEVVEAPVVGGTPDTILNLPTYAKASRLRVDFYELNVIVIKPASAWEYIGIKVGSSPLLSVSNFSYNYELDAIGSWEILIPANDERASVIVDGTAKIAKIYYEDVGHVFTGYIEDHEIVDSETMRVFGTDMMGRAGNNASLWRIDTRLIYPTRTLKYWRDYYQSVIQTYLPGMGLEFQTLPPEPIFVGDGEVYGEFIGVVPAYQSQSILDVLRDFNSTSGAHFRISPTDPTLTVGLFGDDSGLIIAPVGEDDAQVREEGALVLKSFSYLNTKEELTNMIVVQGSNDSFGIAVELRHNSRSLIDETQYLDRTEPGEGVFVSPSSNVGDFYSINLMPGDLIQETYEEFLQNNLIKQTQGSSTFGIQTFANVGWPPQQMAIAVPFTVSESFYPTFVNFFNMGGIGTLRMSIVPASGGVPNTASLIANRMDQTNYFQNQLPGNVVQNIPEGVGVGTNVFIAVGLPSREEREFGVLTELFGFMDLGEQGSGGLPWPLLTPGDYFIVIWRKGSNQFSLAGFPDTLHLGHPFDRLQLLMTVRDVGSAGTAVYFGVENQGGQAVNPGWRFSGHQVAFAIHGRTVNSVYPYAVEGMFAEVVKDNGSGHRVFYMRDIPSIKEYGLRQKSISLPNAIDTSEGVRDIIPASDLLHDQAQVYLTNHAQPFEKLTVTCTGLFRLPYVGQKVRFVYRGMALNENGEYKWLDINSDWFVLGIQWQINNEGLEHTLTLANISDDVVNPRNLSAEFARHLNRSNNNLGELQVATRRLGDGIQVVT